MTLFQLSFDLHGDKELPYRKNAYGSSSSSNADMIKCQKCGILIPTCVNFCSECGFKQLFKRPLPSSSSLILQILPPDVIVKIGSKMTDALHTTKELEAMSTVSYEMRSHLNELVKDSRSKRKDVLEMLKKFPDSRSLLSMDKIDFISFQDKLILPHECVTIGYMLLSSRSTGVITLSLSGGEINDSGLEKIVDSFNQGALPLLRDLDISKNNIGDFGMQNFCRSVSFGALSKLTVFNASRNVICDVGVKAFADACVNGAFSMLNNLDFSHNKIGDTGVCELAYAFAEGYLPEMLTLELSHNNVLYEGFTKLAYALPQNLTFLDISHNNVGNKGMKGFAEACGIDGHMLHMDFLSLSGNNIGDQGFREFAIAICNGNGALSQLTLLDFSDNEIGNYSFWGFADAINTGIMLKIEALNFKRNNISEAGVQALAPAIVNHNMPQLVDIDFSLNPISEDGIYHFIAATATSDGNFVLGEPTRMILVWQVKRNPINFTNGQLIEELDDSD
jgi:hypothetical protein